MRKEWFARAPLIIGLALLLAAGAAATAYVWATAARSAPAAEAHNTDPHNDPHGPPSAGEPPPASTDVHTDGSEHVDGMPGMDMPADGTPDADTHGDEMPGTDPHGDEMPGTDTHGEVAGAAAGPNWYVLGGFLGVNLAVVSTAAVLKSKKTAQPKLEVRS